MKKIFTLLTLLVVTSIYSQIPSYVPTNGLVGYWPFNGNANDISGNTNNLTVNGAILITDRLNNSNSAFGFENLSNKLTLNNIQPTLNNTNISISLWVRIPTQWQYSTLSLVKNGVPYTNGFGVFIDQNNSSYGTNNYQVMFLVGNYNAATFISNQSELGLWSNLVSTYDGSNIKIYLNGVLKSSQPYTQSLNSPNGNLIFASWDNPSIPASVSRQLDDIGIWNRALTQAEITGLYTSLGTSQTEALNQIVIYPNPAKEQITIDCGNLSNTSGWSYKIVNTLGQEVLNGEISTQQNVVSLNTLNGSGFYFVKIYDASNNLLNTKKIILQ